MTQFVSRQFRLRLRAYSHKVRNGVYDVIDDGKMGVLSCHCDLAYGRHNGLFQGRLALGTFETNDLYGSVN